MEKSSVAESTGCGPTFLMMTEIGCLPVEERPFSPTNPVSAASIGS